MIKLRKFAVGEPFWANAAGKPREMAARAFMTNLFRRGKDVLDNVIKGTAQKVRFPRRSVIKKAEPVPIHNANQFRSTLKQGTIQNIWRGFVPKYHFNGTANKISRKFPWRPAGGSALLLAFNTGLVMANGNEEQLSNYVQVSCVSGLTYYQATFFYKCFRRLYIWQISLFRRVETGAEAVAPIFWLVTAMGPRIFNADFLNNRILNKATRI